MFGCHYPRCAGHNDLLSAIHHAQEAIMSTLDDLTAVTGQVATDVARVVADKAAVPTPGTLSAADQAKLDAAVASLGGSVAALSAADPAPVSAPTPSVAPAAPAAPPAA